MSLATSDPRGPERDRDPDDEADDSQTEPHDDLLASSSLGGSCAGATAFGDRNGALR